MQTLLAHQAVTNPATVYGSAVDIGDATQYLVQSRHALVEATANTNAQSVLIQVSQDQLTWITLSTQSVTSTGTAATEAFTATEPVDETVIAVASTTGFTIGEQVYIQDTTLAESEWRWIADLTTDTSITVDGAFESAHALTTSIIWDSAEILTTLASIRPYNYLRAVYLNMGATAANSHVQSLGRITV